MKKFISVFLCVFLLLSVACVGAVAEPDGTETEEFLSAYEAVASQNGNTLYIDRLTGNIAVENGKTGKTYYSCPPDVAADADTKGSERKNVASPLVIEYIYSDEVKEKPEGYTVSTANDCYDPSLIEIEEIENGVRVTFLFPSLMDSTIPVEFTLDGDDFNASIIYEDIEESKEIIIVDIKLLPAFGAAALGEEGYIVVPDGSGAVIEFNNGSGASEYSAMVYGSEIDTLTFRRINQQKKVHLPIFGIVRNDSALLGIITEGDDCAKINAYSAHPGMFGYNTASSTAVYRQNSQVSLFGSDFSNNNTINQWCKSADSKRYTVRYSFLGAEDASYQGIAAAYRDWLIEKKVLGENGNKASLHLDIYNSISTTTAFLGFKYQKQTSLTTFEQTEKILKELSKLGVRDVSAKLVGWTNTGVDNKKIPTRFNFLSNLGGKKDFKSLVAYADKNGVSLTADVDTLKAQSISRNKAVKTYFNKIVYDYLYKNSVYTERRTTKKAILTPDAFFQSFQKLIKKYDSVGLDSVSLRGLGNTVMQTFAKKAPQSRRDMIKSHTAALKMAEKAGYNITLEAANAYAFGYADVITEAPMASSGYEIFDYDIPLYQLVLHGCVTVTTESLPQAINAKTAYLWAVSTGTEPLYYTFWEDADILQETDYDYLYSSTFSWWKDEAAENFVEYSKLLKKVYNSKINEYTEVAEGVIKTVYENGTTVYVNYGATDATADGITVPAGGYTFNGGENA